MITLKSHTLKLSVILFVFALISGCGGSSSTTNSLPTSWEKNIYPKAALLKNYCEDPRPSTSTASYPDKNGSKFLEKMWLRSWSEDVYLWYRELSDINVNSIDTPRDYFETRKTFATTSSGALRDQFHFYYDTDVYNEQVSSGSSISYGMTFKLLSSTPPRKAIVIFVEPNSPADNASISRGAEITSIDGVDLINGDDTQTLNDGLYPKANNETHTFEIVDADNTAPRTVSLQSSTITEEPVHNTKVLTNSNNEKVGYLTFNTFGTYTAEEALVDSFSYLENIGVSDLVLDLRYNGGGFLAISSQLAYMIAGSYNTENRTYYKTVFNDKYPNTSPTSGEAIQAYPFINTGLGLTVSQNQPLPSLNLNRVFVLTTNSSCSASEALMNGLQGIGIEVIQIGEKTCGKPYGFQGTDNCGTTYFTVMFKGVNEVGFGDYADGFYPANSTDIGSTPIAGCEVPDDYSHQLGDVDEAMLNAALQYRDTATCPVISSFRTAQKSLPTTLETDDKNDLLNDSRVRSKLMLQQILITD